jgi:hypothetical protein
MSRENRKRAVSIRMSGSDVGKVKRLAQRLGVRDSDVIRYAVKTMLSRLAPLYDPQVRGRNLVPVFVESGSDLFMHFELDAIRLDGIINEQADDAWRVDHEDIQLIAMSGAQQPYGRWRPQSEAAVPTLKLNQAALVKAAPVPIPQPTRQHERSESVEGTAPSLREYLYDKYVYRNRSEA